jgi:hypothetical protein
MQHVLLEPEPVHVSPTLRHGTQVEPLQVSPRYGQQSKLSGPRLSHGAFSGRQHMFLKAVWQYPLQH